MRKIKSVSCRLSDEFASDLYRAVERDLTGLGSPWFLEQLSLSKTSGKPLPHPQSISADCPVTDVAYAYQLNSLLEKFRRPQRTAELRANALQKFLDVERRLALINQRLAPFPTSYSSDADSGFEPGFDAYIALARRIVRLIVGDAPPSGIETSSQCRFGPGASLGCGRAHRDAYYKYRRWPYTFPHAATELVQNAIYSDQRWFGSLIDEYRRLNDVPWQPLNMATFWDSVLRASNSNTITTVPKNSETDRTIAIESLMGIYLQLGVDGFVRDRLKRFRIDLDDQELNRSAALAASSDGDLATLDLSSASDSVSVSLSELLLPPAWFDLLSRIRSELGVMPDGHIVHYEKISSMGNGFTFALESLVFFALASAVMPRRERLEGRVYIYGDDIIVPVEVAPLLLRLLDYCGFKPNWEKSFLDGGFRESCGMHAWYGSDISPVRLKRQPESVLDLTSLYNRLFVWYANWCPSYEFRSTAAAREIVRHVNGPVLFGPSDPDYSDAWFYEDNYVQPGSTALTRYTRRRVTRQPRSFEWGKLKSTLRSSSDENGASRFLLTEEGSTVVMRSGVVWIGSSASRKWRVI